MFCICLHSASGGEDLMTVIEEAEISFGTVCVN